MFSRLTISSIAVVVLAPCIALADLVVVNARLFDGTGSGVRNDVSVSVSDNRIAEIGPEVFVDAAVNLIDADGMTVLPGLIDAHLHTTVRSVNGPLTPPEVHENEAELLAAIEGIVSQNLSDYLDAGFTSVMDTGGYWPYVVNLRDRVASGEFRAPRMFVSGGVVTAPQGQPASWLCAGAITDFCRQTINAEAADVESARALVRLYADEGRGVDQVKITYDGVIAPPKLSPDVVRAVINEAHRQGIRAVAHALDARDVSDLIAWGIDGFVHPPFVNDNPEGHYFDAFQGRSIPLTITFGLAEHHRTRQAAAGNPSPVNLARLRTQRQNVSAALELGALPVFGSDVISDHPELVKRIVFEALASLELSNAEVLLAATRNAAMLIGRDDLGTLEPGNLADMIIVEGDPLEDLDTLSRVVMVIRDGIVVADNRSLE